MGELLKERQFVECCHLRQKFNLARDTVRLEKESDCGRNGQGQAADES